VTTTVPITRPELGDEEVAALERVVRSGWLMQGREVAAFEAELAAFVGAPHVVACANGTVALELALRALGVGPGAEVATVAHSFIATASAVVAVGATPVFVDVDEATLGMAPVALAAALTPRTRAVIAAHQLGIPCDLGGILDAAGTVPVIEDAACALGSELGGVRVGRPHGRLATFSFHPRKLVTTGEGGAISTADAALAERLGLLRQHGLDASGAYVVAATNARLTDLQAALGRVQLGRLPAALAERRRLAARLDAVLDGHAVLEPVRARGNLQSYPARVLRGDAAQVVAALAARGVAARPGLANAHEEPAFAPLLDDGRARVGPAGLATSERLRRQTVLLPLFHGMSAVEEQARDDALRALV
jgi:dTDP-4-amino-4,6-dideoxygalactose transaminase